MLRVAYLILILPVRVLILGLPFPGKLGFTFKRGCWTLTFLTTALFAVEVLLWALVVSLDSHPFMAHWKYACWVFTMIGSFALAVVIWQMWLSRTAVKSLGFRDEKDRWAWALYLVSPFAGPAIIPVGGLICTAVYAAQMGGRMQLNQDAVAYFVAFSAWCAVVSFFKCAFAMAEARIPARWYALRMIGNAGCLAALVGMVVGASTLSESYSPRRAWDEYRQSPEFTKDSAEINRILREKFNRERRPDSQSDQPK